MVNLISLRAFAQKGFCNKFVNILGVEFAVLDETDFEVSCVIVSRSQHTASLDVDDLAVIGNGVHREVFYYPFHFSTISESSDGVAVSIPCALHSATMTLMSLDICAVSYTDDP